MSFVFAMVDAIFGQLTTDLWKKCNVFNVIHFHENCTLINVHLNKYVNLITSQRTCIFPSIMRSYNSCICLYTFEYLLMVLNCCLYYSYMHAPTEIRTVTVINIKTVKLSIINHISVHQQMGEGCGANRSILMNTN